MKLWMGAPSEAYRNAWFGTTCDGFRPVSRRKVPRWQCSKDLPIGGTKAPRLYASAIYYKYGMYEAHLWYRFYCDAQMPEQWTATTCEDAAAILYPGSAPEHASNLMFTALLGNNRTCPRPLVAMDHAHT